MPEERFFDIFSDELAESILISTSKSKSDNWNVCDPELLLFLKLLRL